MEETKKLYRSRTDRMIFGVCGGLGEYFGIDPIIFRGLFLLLVFGGGAGILVYLILAIVIPNNPQPGAAAEYNPEAARQKINEFAQEMKQGAQDLAAQMNHGSGFGARRSILGLIVVLAGCLLLLDKILPQAWMRWDIFWPVIIIFAGLAIIARRK